MKLPLSRKQVPLLATGLVLVVLFAVASLLYKNFCSLRVVANIISGNAVLGITAVGMTFVILSGGIDLSIGAVVAFTGIFIATTIGRLHIHPLVAVAFSLILGSGFGCAMGLLIHRYHLPPFLVTLGGMFFARGMAFVVNMQSMAISNEFYDRIVYFKIPGTGSVIIPASTLVFVALLIAAIYLAHFTRFGRSVYAVGGNEQSALLMGLPVGRTKVLVYTLNGFCSALAGVVSTIYMSSGDPIRAYGLELDAIASVVIGGTLLSGGVGYVAGTLMGVLIFGTIQTAIIFDGRLNSWWLRIAIGVLLLIFILLQRFLSRTAAKRR